MDTAVGTIRGGDCFPRHTEHFEVLIPQPGQRTLTYLTVAHPYIHNRIHEFNRRKIALEAWLG